MFKLIKWLIKKIPAEQMKELIAWVFSLVPWKDGIDYICDFLAILADKTETEVDDEFVENMRQTLYLLCKV